MSFLGSIFGESKSNNPSWMRDAGKGIFDKFGGMYDDYNPQQEVGLGMENFDRMLRNQGSAQGNGLASRGFGSASNPGQNLTRARFGAGLWSQARTNERDWKRQLLLQQFGMMSGLESLYGETYYPGMGEKFGTAAAKAAAASGGA